VGGELDRFAILVGRAEPPFLHRCTDMNGRPLNVNEARPKAADRPAVEGRAEDGSGGSNVG
jgi:hypothetical protein